MVKCDKCGFLAMRNMQTRELMEVEPIIREVGSRPFTVFGYAHGVEPPLCFVNSYNLWEESGDINHATPETIKSTIHRERICPLFTQWQQGFTPKEHKEMMDRKYLMEMEEKRKKNDRTWHWIEIAIILIFTACFTLLGAYIASPK